MNEAPPPTRASQADAAAALDRARDSGLHRGAVESDPGFATIEVAERRELAGRGLSRTHQTAVEVPTVLLIVATYTGWIAITLAYGHWPLAIVAPIAVLLITLHGSVQHEIVHRHPTRWNGVNRLFAIIPLTLWLPYERYRHTHLAHHVDVRLTDPLDDPESFYFRPEDWARFGKAHRWILQAQQTLAGRVLIGAFWRIGIFLWGEARALKRNQPGVRAVWLEHVLWCLPVLLWVSSFCGIPVWLYLLTMVVPANGILLIRSFAEHRALPEARLRIAIVERSWLLGPLFLFNNLHALHHEAPAIPWYEYNARYRLIRERLLAENGGLLYRSYFDVARRYLFRPHDVMMHPTGRVPKPLA
jgi:fatty acid desaturase